MFSDLDIALSYQQIIRNIPALPASQRYHRTRRLPVRINQTDEEDGKREEFLKTLKERKTQ